MRNNESLNKTPAQDLRLKKGVSDAQLDVFNTPIVSEMFDSSFYVKCRF